MKSSLLGMNWKIPVHSAFLSENTRIGIMRCGCKEFRKRMLDFMRFRGFPQVSANEKIVFPIFHSRNEKKCGKQGRWWLKQRFSFHERKKKLNKDVAGAGQWKKKEPWESRMNWDREYWGLQPGWRKTIRRKRRRKSCGRPPYGAGGGMGRAGTDWNGLGA